MWKVNIAAISFTGGVFELRLVMYIDSSVAVSPGAREVPLTKDSK